jgi:SPP1 gp7 family putative phage head morphogenesis protein
VAKKSDLDYEKSISALENRVSIRNLGANDPRRKAYYFSDLPQELKRYAFYVSGLEKLRTIESVRLSLVRAIEKGQSFDQWRNELDVETFSSMTKARQELVFRTNLNTAYNQGTRHAAFENRDVTPYLMYDAVNDSRVRPSHEAVDGVVRPVDDEFWDTFTPPLGYNCTAFNQNVSGQFTKAYRGFYKGDMVSIKLKSGKGPIRLTLNHPVASTSGFIFAKDLKVGDKVFTNHSEVKRFNSSWNVNYNNLKASAFNVFKAMRLHANSVTKSSSFNFYNDIKFMNKKVHVVSSNRFLSSDLKRRKNTFKNFIFKFASNVRKAFFTRKRPLVGGVHCNVFFSKDFFNIALRNIKMLCNLPSSFILSLVHLGGLLLNSFNIFSEKFLRRPRPWFNSVEDKPLSDRVSTHPELLSKFINRNSFFESTDEVVSVEFYPYFGWVFDFESSHDLVITGGLVTSNCRCALISLSKENAAEMRKEQGKSGFITSKQEIERQARRVTKDKNLNYKKLKNKLPDKGFEKDQKLGQFSKNIKAKSLEAAEKLPRNSPYKKRFKEQIEQVDRKVDLWWESVKNKFTR